MESAVPPRVEMAAQGAGGVMVCDINDEKGIETTEQIRAIGVDAEYRHCDMAEPVSRSGIWLRPPSSASAVSTFCTTTPGFMSPTSRPN